MGAGAGGIPLLLREEEKSNPYNSGRGAVNTPATKTEIRCFGKMGRGKSFWEETGNSLGPGTYINTKPMSTTTAGGTRNSLSPKTIRRPRLTLAAVGRSNRNTGKPYPQGTGPKDLPNTGDKPRKQNSFYSHNEPSTK